MASKSAICISIIGSFFFLWSTGEAALPGLIRDNSTITCTEGSFLPERVPEPTLATCWHPCEHNTTGAYDTSACAEFTCDEFDSAGSLQRRKSDSQDCVVDQCRAGNHTVMDISGKFVCDKHCICPDDGDACEFDMRCTPGTVRCLDGLVLFTHPDGSFECGPSTELSCEEGTMRLDFTMKGGAAFGICICGQPSGAPSDTLAHRAAKAAAQGQHAAATAVVGAGDAHPSTNCTFSTPLPPAKDGGDAGESGVVMCGMHHEVVGARPGSVVLSDGRVLDGGGRCVPVHRASGLSPGLVVLWCLFSMALGPILIIVGQRTWIWYQARQFEIPESSGVMGKAGALWETLLSGSGGRTNARSGRGYGDDEAGGW